MKVFLHTGGLNGPCMRWVRPFKSIIENRGIEIIETNVFDEEQRESVKIYYEEGDFFITRFSEHRFPEWTSCHEELAPLFGKRMFPNENETYYYNDKERQRVLMEEKGYPHPKTIWAESLDDLTLELPLVRKGVKGSSGKQVSLVNSEKDIKFPCLLQEFCRNNDGDIRTHVIGDCITGYKRMNRKNDFRASGGHEFRFLGEGLEELPLECMQISHRISKENNFNCMCYDFVKNENGEWVVLEFSYTFGLIHTGRQKQSFIHDATKNFEKSVNDYSMQELVIQRLLD